MQYIDMRKTGSGWLTLVYNNLYTHMCTIKIEGGISDYLDHAVMGGTIVYIHVFHSNLNNQLEW
jgi:hypothetical protein